MAIKKQDEVKMLAAALHRCCICHTNDVQIHHIDGREFEGADEWDNLAPLCPNCHSRVETKGGHGKIYSVHEVKLYRDHWFDFVVGFHKQAVKEAAFYGADVPNGVPKTVVAPMQALYVALERAYQVLDVPVEGGNSPEIIRSRGMLDLLLKELAAGGRPIYELRLKVASQLDRTAKQHAYEAMREFGHVIEAAAAALRK